MKKTTVTILILICTLFCSTNVIFAKSKKAKIDEVMKIYGKRGQFSGAVLVAEKGKVIYKNAFGFANRDWEIPNSVDTKFRLASISKQFTSMLIFQLVQEGKLNLNDKISDHLKDYRKDTGEKVTLYHLLTNTSGIPSYNDDRKWVRDFSRDNFKVKDFIQKFCSDSLHFEPGSKFEYSNSGFYILGEIIQKVTEKSYEQNLKERIFEPLGMKNTGLEKNKEITSKLATGYDKTFTDIKKANYIDLTTHFSASAIYSTVEDLLLWDKALYSEKLLSKEPKAKMFEPFLDDYACAWEAKYFKFANQDSLFVVSHDGGIEGFNARIVRFVEDEKLIVILRNSRGARMGEITQTLASILYDQNYDLPKRSLAEELALKIEKDGIKKALKFYTSLSSKSKKDFRILELELNRLGYFYFFKGLDDEAIEVFKINIAEFPNSVNVYDSLAEVYLAIGEVELAKKNYRKVLENLPKDKNVPENFRKILKENAEKVLNQN
ncbi:MAG: serine hydrolase [Calditrichaeota bacterium]|nr:MAG: serine hydrolase [Calditrichota bacterium]